MKILIKVFFLKHAKILSKISEETNTTLVFVPNCFYDGRKWQDDRIIHKEIIKRLSKKTKYINVDKELNVFESINLHSISDFHITNRRHSVVFAALHKITPIIINTNLKGHLEPLARDINLKENLINFNDHETKISNDVIKLWKKREMTVKKMLPRVKKLQTQARNQFKKLLAR